MGFAGLPGGQGRACERDAEPDGQPNKRGEPGAAHRQGHGYNVMTAGRFFASSPMIRMLSRVIATDSGWS